MAWLTNKKTGAHFNTDWLADDIEKRDNQIAQNKAQADKLNNVDSGYGRFGNDYLKMTDELYRRTGINVRGNLRNVNANTLAQCCDTLEDLQNKYHINDVTDPNVSDNNRLEIEIPTESFSLVNADAFAEARLCAITLNPKYYKLEPEELDSIYTAGTQGYTPYHPVGTRGSDIIAHEAAHHMLDKKVWELCGHDVDKYVKVSEFLTTPTEYTDMGETTLPEIKTLFNSFDKVRLQYVNYLRKDENAVRYIGSYLHERKRLRAMANPKGDFGFRYSISEYASKNYHELVAESFADYYRNGKQARVLSKMIVSEIFGIK